MGHLSRESSSAHSAPVLGNRLGDPAALSSVLRSEVVDEVIASSALGATELRTLAKIAAEFGVRFRTLVEIPESVIGSFQVEVLGDGLCVLSQERTAHGPLQEAVKRMLDVAGSVLGLAVCGVVCAWYVPRLRKESPGPVFFAQERVGRNGRTFTLYKFRTMYPDADKDLDKLRGRNQMSGFVFKLRDDPRVTPTGRKLRRTHLDELPQFWNVLRGDMSIVGSRPPTREEVEQYEPKHRRRLSIKPGITGLWQIAGNARVNDFDTIVALDCEYIENWSFWLDFRIIARTMIKILRAEGW